MKKMSWKEFRKLMKENIGKGLVGYIVFKEESFDKHYDEKERTYKVNSEAKYWDSSKIGLSLFGDCLDGKDIGVRLDWYMHDVTKPWKVEYCYIK